MPRKSYADGMSLEQLRIFLWFEFYKLALTDPRHRANIRKSKGTYAEWGRVRPGDPFNKWWDKSYPLFGTGVMVDNRQEIEVWLSITIPLNQSESAIIAEVRALVRERQAKLAKKQGSVRRSKSGRPTGIPMGLYDLTPGTEFRVGPALDALTIYEHFVAGKPQMPVINQKLLERVQAYFRKRRQPPPGPISADPNGPNMRSALRSLRRYIYRAEALVEAAARGEFPGKSYKTRG